MNNIFETKKKIRKKYLLSHKIKDYTTQQNSGHIGLINYVVLQRTYYRALHIKLYIHQINLYNFYTYTKRIKVFLKAFYILI